MAARPVFSLLAEQRNSCPPQRTGRRAARALKNLCSSSWAAEGRLLGSFTRHLATMSRMDLLKCFLPVSLSSVGGGFWIVISSTCRATRRQSQPS